MLGTYTIVGHYGNANARDHAELGRYVRSEYRGTLSVEAFLAAALDEAREHRTGWGRQFVDGIRTVARALRSLGAIVRRDGSAEEA